MALGRSPEAEERLLAAYRLLIELGEPAGPLPGTSRRARPGDPPTSSEVTLLTLQHLVRLYDALGRVPERARYAAEIERRR